jgi:hypothetical protein
MRSPTLYSSDKGEITKRRGFGGLTATPGFWEESQSPAARPRGRFPAAAACVRPRSLPWRPRGQGRWIPRRAVSTRHEAFTAVAIQRRIRAGRCGLGGNAGAAGVAGLGGNGGLGGDAGAVWVVAARRRLRSRSAMRLRSIGSRMSAYSGFRGGAVLTGNQRPCDGSASSTASSALTARNESRVASMIGIRVVYMSRAWVASNRKRARS